MASLPEELQKLVDAWFDGEREYVREEVLKLKLSEEDYARVIIGIGQRSAREARTFVEGMDFRK